MQAIVPALRDCVFADALLAMEWPFRLPPRGRWFVTTDCPLAIRPPPGVERGHPQLGISTKGAGKLIPLSASTCLLARDPGTIRQAELLAETPVPSRETLPSQLLSDIAATRSYRGHLKPR